MPSLLVRCHLGELLLEEADRGRVFSRPIPGDE